MINVAKLRNNMITRILFALLSINISFASFAMQKKDPLPGIPASQTTPPAAQPSPYLSSAPMSQSSEEKRPSEIISIFVENLISSKLFMYWRNNGREDYNVLEWDESVKIGSANTLQELYIGSSQNKRSKNLAPDVLKDIDKILRQKPNTDKFTVTINVQTWLGSFLPYVIKINEGYRSKSPTRLWDIFPQARKLINEYSIIDPAPNDNHATRERKERAIEKNVQEIMRRMKPHYFLGLGEEAAHNQIDQAYQNYVNEWQLQTHDRNKQIVTLARDVLTFVNCAYNRLTQGEKFEQAFRSLVEKEIKDPTCYGIIQHTSE